MNLSAINHQIKSNMAYAVDDSHLKIILQVSKIDIIKKVEIIFGDPFDWNEKDGVFYWGGKLFANTLMNSWVTTERHAYYESKIFVPSKRTKYAFLIFTENETYFYGCRNLQKVNVDKDSDFIYDLFGYFNFPYILEEDIFKGPKWSQNTVWYQIFLDRFYRRKEKQGDYLPFNSITEGINNHMFFGGDLLGVKEKIPYLSSLGITGIYFTPIFKAPSAHKYDTEDYFQIDPSFGTNQDFKALVDACHQSGIKVMLDAVFNHCGFQHPYFQDVIKNKKKSKYYDCFYIEDDHFIDFEIDANGRPMKNILKPKYRTFAYTPHMPKLNTNNPIMRQYLLDVATYWIKNYDIDGWRLDVSNEVSHDFWRAFRKATKEIKPDIYILGENWDDSNPWLMGDQMDSVMNYEIAFPIWQFFGKTQISQKVSSEKFQFLINRLLVLYPENVLSQMFNLVDSHDTRRIISRCDHNPEIVKLAYLFIYTFPGSPAIFYGDEIGLEGKEDPDCRRCMIWDESSQNLDLLDFFKKMNLLRKTHQAFQSNEFQFLEAKNDYLIYQRGTLFVIMNNAETQQRINLPSSLENNHFYDVFNQHSFKLGESINMNPYSFIIFEKA